MAAHYKTMHDIVTMRDGHGDIRTMTREVLEGGITTGQVIRRCRVVTVADAERMLAEGKFQSSTGRWCATAKLKPLDQ